MEEQQDSAPDVPGVAYGVAYNMERVLITRRDGKDGRSQSMSVINFMSPACAGQVAEALQRGPPITDLVVRSSCLAGPSLTTMFAAAAQPATSTIKLVGCSLGDDQVGLLISALRLDSRTLTALSLERNFITDAAAGGIATFLAENRALRELDLSGNRMTGTGCAEVAAAAAERGLPLRLRLAQMPIAGEGVGSLVESLMNIPGATELDLSYVQLRPARLAEVGTALQRCAAAAEAGGGAFPLRRLLLQGNKLAADGGADTIGEWLPRILQCCPALDHLDLSNNDLTNACVEPLATQLPDRVLPLHLDLAHNKLGRVATHFATVLSGNPMLGSLDLSCNADVSASIGDFGPALATNTRLRTLNLEKCGGSSEQIARLEAGLASNVCLSSGVWDRMSAVGLRGQAARRERERRRHTLCAWMTAIRVGKLQRFRRAEQRRRARR